MFLRQLPANVKTGLILACFVVSVILAYLMSAIIAPFLISMCIAYVLNPIIRFMERKGIHRPWATVIVFLTCTFLGIVVVLPIFITILSEANALFSRLSAMNVRQLTSEYRNMILPLYERFDNLPWAKEYIEVYFNIDKINELAAQAVIAIKDLAVNLVTMFISFVFSAFSGAMGIFLIPLLTFYIMVDLDMLYENMTMLIPKVYRPSTLRILKDIDLQLGGFLRGQSISCTIFACFMTVGLWLSGLSFALFLGPLAGLANMIPYLGALVTTILATLVAISQYGLSTHLVSVLIRLSIAIIIIQTIDSFFLQPKIIGEKAGLHPLVTMLALLIGGSIFGIIGMILAVPTTCILRVISRELYFELYDQQQ